MFERLAIFVGVDDDNGFRLMVLDVPAKPYFDLSLLLYPGEYSELCNTKDNDGKK